MQRTIVTAYYILEIQLLTKQKKKKSSVEVQGGQYVVLFNFYGNRASNKQ